MTVVSRKVQAECSGRAEFLMPALFMTVSVICLWQTRDMSQLGAVFPATIAVVILMAGVLRLVQLMLRGVQGNAQRTRGSTPRRLLLVVAMVAWALAMPWIGFLTAGLTSFFLLMMIAQHGGWTSRRLLAHLAIGAILVAFFYGLFALLLHVPLPVGRWWLG